MKRSRLRPVSVLALSALLPLLSAALADPVVFTTDTLIAEGDLTYEGSDIVAQGCTVTIQGPHGFGAFTVEAAAIVDSVSTNLACREMLLNQGTLFLAGGAVLDVSNALTLVTNSLLVCQGTNTAGQVGGEWAGRGVTILASNLTVDAASWISADLQGYVAQATDYQNGVGPGFGQGGGVHAGAGGSHGGRGGAGDAASYYQSSPTYGATLTPTSLGSSGGTHWGGPSGAGGGAIRLTVRDTLLLDGLISANGGNAGGHAGGGAGGSVWAAAATLAGSGRFEAKGGSYQPGYAAGGGGGGRIAVYSGDASGFSGFSVTTAAGGSGAEHNGETGTGVMVGTGSTPNSLGVYQHAELQEATATYGTVVMHDGATLTLPAAFAFSASDFLVGTGATVNVGGGTLLSVTGTLWVAEGATVWCQSISNSAPDEAGVWVGRGVTIEAGHATIEPGGAIRADGLGYIGWQADGIHGCGPGTAARVDDISPGAGHGGQGGYDRRGRPGGTTYGSPSEPEELGSGAPPDERAWGGAGGGAVRLSVSGVLNHGGTISANGGTSSSDWACESGAGAGGSLWVTTHTLTGAGVFTANGGTPGSTYWGGAGGGGRIAVYSADDAAFSGFAGSTASSGGGDNPGGAGTVAFFRTSGSPNDLHIFSTYAMTGSEAAYGTVTVHDGGTLTLPAGFALDAAALNVMTGAVLTVGGGSTVTVSTVFHVMSNATVVCQSVDNAAQVGGLWAGRGVTINAGDVAVDAGGRISADATGYASMHDQGNHAGNGPGGSSSINGGSYGGLGTYGSWYWSLAPVYGTALTPEELGSSGGSWESRWSGAGGGAIRLNATGTLTLDGVISANGGAPSEHSGAGSGGSLWVTTAGLSGSGNFQATGGSYNPGYAGGAGGGGRVAVYYTEAGGFTGFDTSTVVGGSGWNGYVGGRGSLLFIDTSVPGDSLHVFSEISLPDLTNTFDTVTVHADGVLSLPGDARLTLTSLLHVLSNGTVRCQGVDNTAQVGGLWVGRGVTIQAGNVLVEAGGHISADGQGYAGQGAYNTAGIGPGGAPSESGGSYGGVGATGARRWGVGPVYGSSLEPADLGSSGGNWENYVSGAGGGALRLDVAGSLVLDGVISANGNAPSAHSGAGSGGSLWVTALQLGGSGRFEALGGSANPGHEGAGGGGGRVAVYYAEASGFSGFDTSAVTGGSGWNGYVGGSGSLFFIDTSVPGGSLHVFSEISLPELTNTFDTVTVHADGVLSLPGDAKLTLTSLLHVLSNGTVRCQGVDNTAQAGGLWIGRGVTLQASNVLVEAGGRISADGQGYAGQGAYNTAGIGPGGAPSESGGSYGGAGATGARNWGVGPVYGSALEPADLGSSGGNWESYVSGAGGGALRLDVAGSLVLDGVISANGIGPAAHSGAGSGGSLWVTAQQLGGAGRFEALGGSANPGHEGAGGGGGRVAVYYAEAGGFTGFDTSTVAGGSGWNGYVGGSGSLLFIDASVPDQRLHVYGDVVLPELANTFESIVVYNGGRLTLPGGSTLAVNALLRVASNGTVRCQSSDNAAQAGGLWAGRGVTIDAAEVTVEAGGAISADGQGYAAVAVTGGSYGKGPGAGQPPNAGSGGGHGGRGGDGAWGCAGGLVYGTCENPVELGSSGGSSSWWSTWSGAGGGALLLRVGGTLTVDGQLSANGNGASHGSGGGAGGSLWVTAPTLQGGGRLQVNGGPGGVNYGGGGGGGRLYCVVNTLAESLGLQSLGGAGDAGGWGGGGGSVVVVYTNAAAPATLNVTVAPGAGGSPDAGFVLLLHDTDLDGLSDEEEAGLYNTDPTVADTDGDGQSDGDEVAHGMNPLDAALFQTSISGEILYGGTQTGTVQVVAWENAYTNQVLSLDGSGDYVLVPDAPSLDMTTAITVECWVRGGMPQPESIYHLVDKSHGFTDATGWVLAGYGSQGNINFTFGDGATFHSVWAGCVLDATWHHIAGTYNGVEARIYVDGSLYGVLACNVPLVTNGRPLEIGASWGGGSQQRFFNGQVDDVRVWNRVLTASEIQAGMCRRLSGAEPGLAGCWNFDDGTASDLTANANHGTLQDAATIAQADVEGVGYYAATIPAPGPYTITGVPTPTNYTVSCFRDFNENGTREFWESQALYPENPVTVTNAVTGIDMTLPVVAPPTADAGGPYSVDEFTGAASAGGWTVPLNGGNSTDTVSGSTLLTYEWDLGTDAFEGLLPDSQKWYVPSSGIVQSNMIAITGNSIWGQRYLVSRDSYGRAEGLAFEFTAMFSSGDIVIGWKNANEDFHYGQFVHALDFYNQSVYLGEYTRGWSTDTGYDYAYDTWYDIRIELKPLLGARYYYRPSGTQEWTLLGETAASGDTVLRRGVTVGSGTCTLASVKDYAVGPTPACRFYGQGVHPITLTVTDPTGLQDADSTTVTTLANDPPVALLTPPAQTQFESNAVERVWTFPFSAAASSDDHGIYTFEWDWAYDGTFTPSGSTDATPTHAWTNAGTYAVALRVTDHALQTHLSTATVTVVTGAAPTALPGGPYTFDEFSGNASAGAWNIVLNGTNSFDGESQVVHYQWDLGTDTFDGTAVYPEKWVCAAEGVSQNDEVTFTGNTTWGQRYLFSRDFYRRDFGMAFEARVKASAGINAMAGYMNTGTRYHYDQMPYAFYFEGGNIRVYEDASDRGVHGSYAVDQWYQIRIELKAAQGARYFIKEDGAPEWTLVYDSSYGTATEFRRGVDAYSGTFTFDDLRELAAGPTPAYRLYEEGARPVALTVWDQVLNTNSASTTVTLVKNAPPVANMGGNKYGSETNCAGGLWTFLFSAAPSTDDHDLYRFEWDWDYNESLGFRPSGDTGVSARHTFSASQLGSNPVAVRVTDHVMQTSVHAAFVVLSPGQAPVAEAGGPYTVEAGTWLILDGSGSSDDYEVARYAWDFGDATAGTGVRPQHRYDLAGDYAVSLVVYDNYDQASAAATATVHVVEAQAPTADAGGEYTGAAGGPPVYFNGSLSHDATGVADGIAKYLWDLNIASDSDGNGDAGDDMDRVGVRPFFTYDTVGVYTAKLTVVNGASQSNSAFAAVTILPNLAPDVLCVPYHGNTNEYHPTYAGATVTLKGIVRDAGQLAYSWDFGDGTTSAVQSVGNAYAIEASHVYTGGEGKTYLAQLTVWDSEGLAGSDEYRIWLFGSNTETRASMAVDEGLWWLHKNQNRGNGSWAGCVAGATASALQAFEINGHRVDGRGDVDPYVETVDAGFRYLFTTLRVNDIGPEFAPRPPKSYTLASAAVTMPTSYSEGIERERAGAVAPAPAQPLAPAALAIGESGSSDIQTLAASNGRGIDISCSNPPYELGMVMDALAASQARSFIAATGPENVKGQSFYDLLQDMVDMYAWGQEANGGWRYYWHYGSSDNSVSQWGAIGIRAAEDNFGIACPEFVKQSNRNWLNASWNGTVFGYDGAGGHPWGTTVNTTPSAMVQMSMDDYTTTNYIWSHTEDVIAAGWDATYGNPASMNYYGRYALTKALRLARPSKVEIFNNGFHWYEDETSGIRRVITDQQYPGGYWSGDFVGGGLGAELSTAWAVVMLTPSLFTQPPKAVITAPSVWGYGIPLTLTAERSFSIDPLKAIAKYMWDFDNDGNFDLITADPADPAAEWMWPDPHPAAIGDGPIEVTVHLKVVDNDDPPQSDETFRTLIIAEPPHAPYAHATVPPSASAGVEVTLSAADSFDIDPTDFITQYEWDFNNDDEPDLVTSEAALLIRFPQPGVQTVALRVVDNGVMNDGVKMTSEWDYATCMIAVNQAPVAHAGGPYTAFEGRPVTLVATNSYDPNGDALYYAWDFDGDGLTDSTNAVTANTWMLPGMATVWLAVSDTALSNSVSATFEVLAVNHAPSFAKGADQQVDEDSGQHTAPAWASGISSGPAHEAWQSLAFVCSNTVPALFSGQPGVSASGTLAFTPAPNANGVATVSVYLQDDGGTAYDGVDRSPVQTFQIVVSAVNDAPVLTPANPVMTGLTEDETNNAGMTVAAIVGTTIGDADAGALQGVAVFTNIVGNGAWQYSTNAGVSWAGMGAVSTNAALLLRSQDRVRYLPDARNGTAASFGYAAWDQTSGGAATKQSVAVRGGTTAYSLAADTASVTVSPVNDAPVLTVPADRVMNELTALTVTNLATDVDLPANALTFELLAAPVGLTLDADTGVIAWTPSEAQGPCVTSVTVRVYDSGSPLKAATNSFTVTVNEVNLAPVLTVPADQVMNELTTLTVTSTATDADLPANTLTFELLAAPVGLTLDANTGVIAWTPSEAQGPCVTSVTVRVYDSGSPYTATTNRFTVTVNEVNLAPVLTPLPDFTLVVDETLDYRIQATDSDYPSNTLTFTFTTVGEFGPPANAATLDPHTGQFSWTPTDMDEGNVLWFTVTVTDGGTPPLASSDVLQVNVGGRPPVLGLSTLDGVPHLLWNTVPPRRYQLQYKSRLSDSLWNNLGGEIRATGETEAFDDDPVSTHTNRFYHVLLLPEP